MSEHPECRILIVSASLDQARTAVKLIRAFVNDPSDLPPSNTFIPWTIRNRYYSADVHFHLLEYARWDPQSALRVPAVIFVWARGQPYAEQVFALHNGLSRFEPEVALAIALGHEPPHPDDPPEGPDSFLADHGFEYIDGECARHAVMASVSVSVSVSEASGDGDGDDVQGLPRVIDALSTIMWPTMVRERDNNSGKRKSQLQPSLFDFDDVLRAEDEDDEEETLAALMEADAADHGVPQTRGSRMQKEMKALERWLVENEEMHEAEFGGTGIDNDDDDADDDDHDGGDAQPSVQTPVPASAPIIHAPSEDNPWGAASSAPNPTPSTARRRSIVTMPPPSGFDDDFSAFVSAPPAISLAGPASASSAIARSSLIRNTSRSQASLLMPSHTGGSFRSSLSDVEIWDDAGYEALDDRSTFSPEHEHEHTLVSDDDANPRASTSQRFGERGAGLGDVPFDLANILSTLQTMREDVAGIEDEAERRATTAHFASEFVFNRMGVDGDEKEETED